MRKAEYISLYQFNRMFPDEASAIAFYEEQRWPDGVICPRCDDGERVKAVESKKPQPYHCGACRKYFSVKVGTVMESSKIPLHTWLLVTYMMTVARKGISSHQVAREVGITQKSAWFLLQRIRESWETGAGMFTGEVEVDEAYFGGKERNKHASKKQHLGRGPVGKAAVVVLKSRETGRVKAYPIINADRLTLHGLIKENVESGSMIYTDDWRAYRALVGYDHESVAHSAGEYVRGQAHTNGAEAFWALMKRAYVGTFHHFSWKHLHRYVNEFAERQNTLGMTAMERFGHFVRLTVDKRIRYEDLTA